jgi:hypothetical protein
MSAVLAWLQANPVTDLAIWGAVNAAVISPLAAKLPPTTWYGKALHIVGAISPLDALKAFKAFGAELSVPTGGGS